MSSKKKQVRDRFRTGVFERDSYRCRICGITSVEADLDAHHITNRNDMPNGGYVKENGVSLCPEHHVEAENFLQFKTGEITPDLLYKLIGSSLDLAIKASLKLS